MNLMSNSDLTINQLFRKRDAIQHLLDLGYDLHTEYDHLLVAISDKIIEMQGGIDD